MIPSRHDSRTLADIAERIGSDKRLELTSAERSQMRSAISRFAKAVGRAPSEIVAEPPIIRRHRSDAAWQRLDVTKRTWANTLSLLSKAMELAGIKVHRSRRNFRPCEEWEALLGRHPDENGRRDLTRFAGWCTERRIGASAVDDAVFADYLAYLEEASIQRNPLERWHVARRAWNRGVAAVTNWPGEDIPAPPVHTWRARPWATFPESLQRELDAYRQRSVEDAPFDEDHRRLKPITVENYLQRLKEYCSRLVDDGVAPEQLASIEDLIDVAMVKRGLQLMMDGRTLEKAAAVLSGTTNALLSIARFIGAPEVHRDQLKLIAKKVRIRPSGMTAKNRSRLLPFEDPDLVRSFLRLPLEVFSAASKIATPRARDAQRLQMALALEILLHAPMRRKNLASLDLEVHFSRPVATQPGAWRISIPASEVKNAKPLEFELPERTVAVLQLYLERFRPLLDAGASSHLFISQGGRAKSESALSKQLAAFIARELGVKVNAHLIRHITAFLYLSANPGEYEAVRQMLGHKSITTTAQFYAGAETKAAQARWHGTLKRLMGQEPGEEARP